MTRLYYEFNQLNRLRLRHFPILMEVILLVYDRIDFIHTDDKKDSYKKIIFLRTQIQ